MPTPSASARKAITVTREAPPTHTTPPAAGTLVVEEPRFAIVPEWVIDAALSDGAFRLYSLLLRYGNGSGSRMPSRQTLARRLRRSVDAVDRAMRQLTEAGIVRVEHRRSGEQFLSNRYHVRTTPPADVAAAGGGGRASAATPEPPRTGGRKSEATPGRISAGRVAAEVRPNPEILTDIPPPPTPSRRGRSAPTPVEVADHDLLDACGITALDELARQCMTARQVLGKPTTRWTARCLAVVIKQAVVTRGWPPASMEQALLAVAQDPESRSPARVAEAGPWWDTLPLGADQAMDTNELAEMEARLAETDGPATCHPSPGPRRAHRRGHARHSKHRRAPCLRNPRPPPTAMNAKRPTPPRFPLKRISGCRTEDSDGMRAMLRATSSSLQRRHGHARHRVPAGSPAGCLSARDMRNTVSV